MREIKFRAWDKKNKRMLHVEHGDILSCGGLSYEISPVQIEVDEWFTSEEAEWFNDHKGERPRDPVSEDFELMQFTGLKDKNGKEIYEGDVIKHEWETPSSVFNPPEGGYFLLEVTFKDGCFYAEDKEDPTAGGTLPLMEYCPKDCEVIGNIYETSTRTGSF